jgi:hypothetical protein
VKYFTHGKFGMSNGRHYGQHAPPMPQHMDRAPFLLFHDTDEDLTRKDLETLQQSSDLDSVYPGHCFLNLVTLAKGNEPPKSYILVTPHPGMNPTPDKSASYGVPMRIGGQPHALDLRQRFNACRSMIKNALGCAKCPDNGTNCLAAWNPAVGKSYIDKNYADQFRNMKTQIAGFTFVSPVLTRDDHFEYTDRDWAFHDFDLIEKNHKMRVQNSIDGAVTRGFRKKACHVCPMNGFCPPWDSRGGRCVGPLPPSDQIDKMILDQHLPAVKAAKFPEWQFWAAAFLADGVSSTKFQHRRVRLEGVGLTAGKWKTTSYDFVFRIVYDAHPFDTAIRTTNYDLLVTYFGLPPTKKDFDNMNFKASDHAKAMFLASLNESHGASHPTFCGTNCYSVGTRRVEYGSIVIRWQLGRCFGSDDRIDSWHGYAYAFGHKPPVPHIGHGTNVGQ